MKKNVFAKLGSARMQIKLHVQILNIKTEYQRDSAYPITHLHAEGMSTKLAHIVSVIRALQETLEDIASRIGKEGW